MLCFIAASMQSCTNSMSYRLIARLQPLSNRDHIDVLTLNEIILMSVKILQQPNIKIFMNAQFDKVVLHTVWTRLENNEFGSLDASLGFIDKVVPQLPLFNQSCDANVEWRRH